MNRQLVAELESVLRSSSARSLSATAGGTNYAAQAEAVAQYIAPLLCADCADDLSDSGAASTSAVLRVAVSVGH